MGREVRMVPADWEHPVDDYRRKHIPLYDGYEEELVRWKAEHEKWNEGFVWDYDSKGWVPRDLEDSFHQGEYWDYAGGPPEREDYMLIGVPREERTHYMMYETTSEGTPISPAFPTKEELARWLADTNASAFGGEGASYEAWLSTINRGYAISAIFSPQTGLISGAEAELLFEEE